MDPDHFEDDDLKFEPSAAVAIAVMAAAMTIAFVAGLLIGWLT